MSVVYLLLGSNEGDKVTILQKAVKSLELLSDKPLTISSLYESEPWGFNTNEWFINQAVKMETSFEPHELLKSILDIEKNLGRVRSAVDRSVMGYCSRTIDIDIIFYDNLIINKPELTIPHPKMHLRKFVLMPLSEIAPKIIHPLLNKSIETIIEECNDNLIVRCKKSTIFTV